jgi:hypothetical protein
MVIGKIFARHIITGLILTIVSTPAFPQETDTIPPLPECYLFQGISTKSSQDIIPLINRFHTQICTELGIDQAEFEQNCHIYIAFKDPPTGRANFEITTLTSSVTFLKKRIKYKASLEILNPDLYNGKKINEAGLPYDCRYFHKLLIHEISTCYLEYLLASKTSGWGSKETPNWFRQGLEEYYGLHYSDDYWRTEGFREYLKFHLGKKGGINFQLGIYPRNPYLDGAVFFVFLHEKYGAARIRQIIISDQPDPGAAMASVLDTDLAKLADEFSSWRREKAKLFQLKVPD